MSAEILREAAALMRARAEAATPGPWLAIVGSGPKRRVQQTALVGVADLRGHGEKGCLAVFAGLNKRRADDAEHMAAWHPPVALAVADYLDHAAARAESKIAHGGGAEAVWSHEHDALTVARAYLGEDVQ